MWLDTAIKTQEEAPATEAGGTQKKKWADPMATNGQFCWPSVGNSVAAHGHFLMAADSRPGCKTSSDRAWRR